MSFFSSLEGFGPLMTRGVASAVIPNNFSRETVAGRVRTRNPPPCCRPSVPSVPSGARSAFSDDDGALSQREMDLKSNRAREGDGCRHVSRIEPNAESFGCTPRLGFHVSRFFGMTASNGLIEGRPMLRLAWFPLVRLHTNAHAGAKDRSFGVRVFRDRHPPHARQWPIQPKGLIRLSLLTCPFPSLHPPVF